MPRGLEERAVRRALARARRNVAVFASGIGPRAAARAAERAADAGVQRALLTGVCGLLSPAFGVGDVLIYSAMVAEDGSAFAFEHDFGHATAARLTNAQSGIVALAGDRVVTRARDKRMLGERYRADAVDMETLAFARCLRAAGVEVAAVRVASDASSDELPDISRAVTAAGEIDGRALVFACVRRPAAALRFGGNALRSLRALERAVFEIVRTDDASTE